MNQYVEAIIKDFEIKGKAIEVRSMLDFLVKDEDDYNNFYKHVILGRRTAFMALCKLQEDKLKENKMSKTEFLEMFKVNPIEALEKLFQDRISEKHLNYMIAKGVTAEYLYDEHMKSPSTVMLKLCIQAAF